jgi:hypothetical protein
MSKTLDQLEGTESSAPTVDSYLVRTCRGLRTKPIGEFSVEDLRIMIGQGIGLPFLIPLALDVLDREPLAEGGFYPGDLLRSCLAVEPAFWDAAPALCSRLRRIIAELSAVPRELVQPVASFKAYEPADR